MNETQAPAKTRWQRLRSLLVNAVVIVAVFIGVMAYQSRNMLSTGAQAAPELRGVTLAGETYDLADAGSRPALV